MYDNHLDEDRAPTPSRRERSDDASNPYDWRLKAPFDKRLAAAVAARAREDREALEHNDGVVAWNHARRQLRIERFGDLYGLKLTGPFDIPGFMRGDDLMASRPASITPNFSRIAPGAGSS
jgi:hypothetical protein